MAGEASAVLEAPAWGPPHVAPAPAAGGAPVSPLLPALPRDLQARRDDAWLAARIGRLRPDPFDILFERHWAGLRSYCLGVLGSADDAQDAAQESMLRAYRRLWRTKDARPFKPLLFAIARNACVDRLRERRRHGGPVEDHHLLPAASSDEVLGRRGRVALLVADLRALSERQRTALVLRETCGLSHTDIADTLETTPARVKSLISEARQALTERRSGRELSCDEYRRAVLAIRGRPRKQSLLAHRAACARCGEGRPVLYAIGLPVLALAWVLRGARSAVRAASSASSATPGAAKVAMVVAVAATPAIPAAMDETGPKDVPAPIAAPPSSGPPASAEPARRAARTARPARPDLRRGGFGPATGAAPRPRVRALVDTRTHTSVAPRDGTDGRRPHQATTTSLLPVQIPVRLGPTPAAPDAASARLAEAADDVRRVAQPLTKPAAPTLRPAADAVRSTAASALPAPD